MSSTAKPERKSRRLNASDPAVREAFEQLFYRGFEHVTHNKLIQTLWDWDVPNRRLRTRVPYEDQLLWGRYTGERFDAGVAVNVKLRELQSAAFGFKVPPELAPQADKGQVCEIMALFVVEDNSLSGIFAFWNDVFEQLRAEGFTHALATTATKILPLYRRIGAVSVDEAVIEGEARHFLHFDLARTNRWVKRESRGQDSPELSQARYLGTPTPPPEEALHQVDQELGLQLTRLLVVLNIARGGEDEGYDLDLRRRSAALIRLSIQKHLAHVAAVLQNPDERKALARREKQLAVMDVFTESVHGFAALARQTPGELNQSLLESLDFLLLTALRAWDEEEGQQEFLSKLTREDRGPMLAQLRRDSPEAGDQASVKELDGHFVHAIRMLHRLFEQ